MQVVNFNPSRKQIKFNLLLFLLEKEEKVTYNEFTGKTDDILKTQFSIMEIEDKIYQSFNQFDYSGSIEKNNSNQALCEKLRNDFNNHNSALEQLANQKDRLKDLDEELSKLDQLTEDGAYIWKLISKFNLLDTVYNFSFDVFKNLMLDFYRKRIKEPKIEYKRNKENLLLLIRYFVDKVAFLFTYEDRKVFMFLVLCYYLGEKRVIFKQFKNVFKMINETFIDKDLKGQSIRKSPFKPEIINDFTWTCIMEINDRNGNLLKPIIDSINDLTPEWEAKLAEVPCDFTFAEERVENKSNIFAKLIFFSLARPYTFIKLLDHFIISNFGGDYKIPKIKIPVCLDSISNRKPILIIDNLSNSEKEVIEYHQKKFLLEGLEFYDFITLQNDLQEDDFAKINNSIKNGTLLFIKEAYKLKSGLQKIVDLLTESHVIHDNFRLIFLTKSNENLSTVIYENCLILNRNLSTNHGNMKDYLLDTIENIDFAHFESFFNKVKSPHFARKIFFHLIIVHSILKQYHIFGNGTYSIPFEFNKKDFFNCIYFVANFFKNMEKEEKESQVYFGLVNIIFDNFYGNRVLLKEDFVKVTKILMKYFDEESFLNEGLYFSYKNNKSTFKIGAKFKDKEVTLDQLIQTFDEIPIESYYSLVDNIDYGIIDDQLRNINTAFYRKIYRINGWSRESDIVIAESSLLNNDDRKYNMNAINKKLQGYKNNLVLPINIDEEAPPNSFKYNNKTAEYNYPIDECLKLEVASYNEYLVKIAEEIDYFNRVVTGHVVYENKFNNIVLQLAENQVPVTWINKNFKMSVNKKESKNALEDWFKLINQRFAMLREWVQKPTNEFFCVHMVTNFKQLLNCIQLYFARKNNVTQEEVELKFNPTKYYKIEQLEPNPDTFFIYGFSIVNAKFNLETMAIEECPSNIPSQLPVIAITSGFVDFSEVGDVLIKSGTINVPLYDQIYNSNFGDNEPFASMNLAFDPRVKEESWIIKGVKIYLDK